MCNMIGEVSICKLYSAVQRRGLRPKGATRFEPLLLHTAFFQPLLIVGPR